MADAVCVDPKQVHIVWPKVSHWIKRAIERGDLGTFSDVEADVLNGASLLWLVWAPPNIEAATVTQVVLTERSKSCVIVACGGDDARQWIGLIAAIESYARSQECDCVRIFGRRGWARMLPEYQTSRIVLERQL